MSDHTVSYTIKIGGGAAGTLGKIAKAAGGVTGSFKKLGEATLYVNQIVQTFGKVKEAVEQVAGKMKELVDAYNVQAEAEAKLAQVMRNTMGARGADIDSIKALASAQQRLGVIGDEVQLAGAQELGTYLSKTSTLKKLLPVMNDMLAQQYGVNASQEEAVQIASMLGKVMDGQVGALSRYGYKFDKAQERVLKFGSEEKRAAMLAKVVGDAVGGMNQALAKTTAGKMRQLANSWGDLKEEAGALAAKIANPLLPVAGNLLNKLHGIVEVPLPQQIAREKVELNSLVGALIENYEKEDERKKLIDEIQAKYPDFLKNIDLEKSSTQDLRDALKEVNEEYDKRMKKAAFERRIAELEEEESKSEDSVLKYEQALWAIDQIAAKQKEAKETMKGWYLPSGAAMNWYAGYVTADMGQGQQKVGLTPEQEAQVEAWASEYKELSSMTNGLMEEENKSKLAKAREKRDRYRRRRELIKAAVDAEFGADGDESGGSGSTGGGISGVADAASAGVEAAVTGGTRNTTVNINLGKMIEQVVFSGSWEESSRELEDKVQESLYRILALAATV